MPRRRPGTGWSTSAGATSRRAASAPSERSPSILEEPNDGSGSDRKCGGDLWGGQRHRRGDRAGVRGRGRPRRGRRSRSERPRSGQAELPRDSLGLVADVTDFAAVRRIGRGGLRDALAVATTSFSRSEPARGSSASRSGSSSRPTGTCAQGQPDRRRQRGARIRPGDGRGEPDRRSPAAHGSSRSMLFLSSVAGQIGSQTDPPYSAAKAAVINFAQCAAKDLAPFGVRVNSLCPGMVQTPLNRGGLRGLGQGAARIRTPILRGMDGRQDQEARPLEPLATARGHRRHGRLPRLEPGAQHHRPDHQRRWRLCDALVSWSVGFCEMQSGLSRSRMRGMTSAAFVFSAHGSGSDRHGTDHIRRGPVRHRGQRARNIAVSNRATSCISRSRRHSCPRRTGRSW